MKTFLFLLVSIFSMSAFATLPQVNFTYSSRDISEGQEITVVAQLSATSANAVVVPFTVYGSAGSDDHDLVDGSFYFAPNNLKASISFNVYNDNFTEDAESIDIVMRAPSNATLGETRTHTVIIHDADFDVPEVNFVGSSVLIREDNTLEITAELSAPTTQFVSVPFTVSGSAQYPYDHNLIAGNLIFFPGSQTASLSVSIYADGTIEQNETIIVNLKAPTVNASLGSHTVYVVTVEATYPGSVLEGVNKTLNSFSGEGANHFAKLELLAGSNPVGGFNGGGAGNKAYYGMSAYNSIPASQFNALTFKTKVPSSSSSNKNAYVNFQMDLNCNPSNPSYAIITMDFMANFPGPINQWNTYSIHATDNVFKAVGAKCGLPMHTTTVGAPLSVLTTNCPQACFVNASTGDGGQKKNAILSSILLILGDSSTITANSVYIDDIEVDIANHVDHYTFE